MKEDFRIHFWKRELWDSLPPNIHRADLLDSNVDGTSEINNTQFRQPSYRHLQMSTFRTWKGTCKIFFPNMHLTSHPIPQLPLTTLAWALQLSGGKVTFLVTYNSLPHSSPLRHYLPSSVMPESDDVHMLSVIRINHSDFLSKMQKHFSSQI